MAGVKFDPAYVTDKKLLEDKPDIFFMVKTDEDTLDVIKKIKNEEFKQSAEEGWGKLPVMTYDEAYEFRDRMLEND